MLGFVCHFEEDIQSLSHFGVLLADIEGEESVEEGIFFGDAEEWLRGGGEGRIGIVSPDERGNGGVQVEGECVSDADIEAGRGGLECGGIGSQCIDADVVDVFGDIFSDAARNERFEAAKHVVVRAGGIVKSDEARDEHGDIVGRIEDEGEGAEFEVEEGRGNVEALFGEGGGFESVDIEQEHIAVVLRNRNDEQGILHESGLNIFDAHGDSDFVDGMGNIGCDACGEHGELGEGENLGIVFGEREQFADFEIKLLWRGEFDDVFVDTIGLDGSFLFEVCLQGCVGREFGVDEMELLFDACLHIAFAGVC